MKFILKNILPFLVFMSFVSFSVAQSDTEYEKNIQIVSENIPFPTVYFNLVLGFNAEMIDISKKPVINKYKKMSFPELESQYESGNADLELLLQLYYRYDKENDSQKAYFYLMKLYEQALTLHKREASNYEAVHYLSIVFEYIDRRQDILPLWESYVEKNPNSAKAWAKLGLYQMLISTDSLATVKSLDKALSINANEPEIYVAAMNLFINNVVKKAQQGSASAKNDFDISFFKNAAQKYPGSTLAKYSFDILSCYKLFYISIFSIADKAAKGEKFKLIENREKEWKRLSKIFKNYVNSKVVTNKYLAYKCLLLLDLINTNSISAQKNIKSAVAFLTDDDELYRMLSFIYSIEKNLTSAIENFKIALQYKSIPQDYFTLSQMYFDVKDYNQALQILLDLYKKYPNNYDYIFAIVSIKMRERKFEEACATISQLKQYFTAETNIEGHPYHIFFSAVCMLIDNPKSEEGKDRLNKIATSELNWAVNAKKLLEHFK